MTDLDGLPALQRMRDAYDFTEQDDFDRELRQLVERERKAAWDEACDAGAAIYRAEYEQRLPAWAKPVMRAAVVVAEEGDGITDADDELVDQVDALTEAQIKEIGEDDG